MKTLRTIAKEVNKPFSLVRELAKDMAKDVMVYKASTNETVPELGIESGDVDTLYAMLRDY